MARRRDIFGDGYDGSTDQGDFGGITDPGITQPPIQPNPTNGYTQPNPPQGPVGVITPPATTPPPGPQVDPLHARVDEALKNAGSTDNADYWYGKVGGDPNGMGSAWDYWLGRINQGDGAAGVRNGTIQKFNDSPQGGSKPAPQDAGGLIQQLQQASGGGGYAGAGQPDKPKSMEEIQAQLAKLFPDGAFNQDVVNRRSENASETLGRQAKSRRSTDNAILASRGLMGSGPEGTALNRVEQDTADSYQNAVSGIYADESQKADSRMMQALQAAAGLSSQEAQFAIDQFNSQTGRGGQNLNFNLGQGNLALGNKNSDQNFTLGQGNLALGNLNAGNNYNLGRGQLNLGYDTLNSNSGHQSNDELIRILQVLGLTGDTASKGHV